MYEVEFSYPIGIWTGEEVWCGHCWTFEDAVEDFDRRIQHETIDSQKVDRVVMSKWVLSILKKIEKENAFNIIVITKQFNEETSFENVPKFYHRQSNVQ